MPHPACQHSWSGAWRKLPLAALSTHRHWTTLCLRTRKLAPPHACAHARIRQANISKRAAAHRALLQQLDDGVQAPDIAAIRVYLHQERPAAPAPVATTFATAPLGASGDPALRPGAFRLLRAKKRCGPAAHCAAWPCCDSAVVQHAGGRARCWAPALCKKIACQAALMQSSGHV